MTTFIAKYLLKRFLKETAQNSFGTQVNCPQRSLLCVVKSLTLPRIHPSNSAAAPRKDALLLAILLYHLVSRLYRSMTQPY